MANNNEALREAILSQGPTDQQRDAIFADELEFLLRASPGSGKTWTSCRRFIWRGANWPHSVGGLALLSFTNAAIREFKEATIQIGRQRLLSDPNYVGTFDSFVERYIITPFGHLIADLSKRPKLFTAARPGDWNNKKLQAWMVVAGNRKRPVPAWEIIPFPAGTDGHIQIGYKTSSSYGGKVLTIQGHNPVKEFMSTGFYTHSQRVYWACRLLVKRPHIAALIARRFPEIVVDEAQDTNAWLLILLNILRKQGSRITLIGDPDQCIYEFSMADATSLPKLKDKWQIPEKPLSRSFRCNNEIAAAVKNVGGNEAFTGCGDRSHKQHGAFIVREASGQFTDSISTFLQIIKNTGIPLGSSAIICRAHRQLESVRGEANYRDFKGKTRELAKAAFIRDCHWDYSGAFRIIEAFLREITGDADLWRVIDDTPESEEAWRLRLSIWKFVKSPERLPTVQKCGAEWIETLRLQMALLLKECGIEVEIALGRIIRKTGLDDSQMQLPLFAEQETFPTVRQDTIHQVKGESIDAVLAIGSPKFWNSVISAIESNETSEDRRLAYVAMTRARHVLCVALPFRHFDRYSEKWLNWGFELAPELE
jgi:superfamily I DNA/RNA helicase